MTSRTSELIGRMTLEEKAAFVSGSDQWHTVAIDRLGIPAIMCSDGPHGLRAQLQAPDQGGLLDSEPATCFPTASAIASTWDPDLIREVGVAIADEARGLGVSIVLGPGVNIKRSPLCGRNFEYFSEDPYLAGELGLAMVGGIQSRDVGTSLKHYAANNQEDDRLRVSAEVDERTLREIYLPAFERIVTAGQPWTVMCAYNQLNGIQVSEHHWLLTEVLRGEWDFEGVVVSDWGAVHDRVAAVRAGLDWEMPPDLERSPAAVVAAVRDDSLDEAILDRSVERVLRLVERGRHVLELDETPETDAHHALARRAAADSIVLLKNDGGLLPLDSDGSVAVIGEFARTPRFQGAGSSQVNPIRVDVALDELRAALGDRISFAPGYGTDDTGADEGLRAEAVELAKSAGTIVCFLGLPASAESEGFDRTHMDLPASQLALLEAVRAVNDRVVVALVNGGTVTMQPWSDGVPTVLECWLGGQAAGGAIADVLTGTAEPGGRLAETMPVRLTDVPSTINFPGDSGTVRYGEGLFVGYRAHDHLGHDVSFPFGHGLSYTSFELSDLAVTVEGAVGTDTPLTATVSIEVANTGSRRGAHVVQVYVGDDEASVVRPPRELKGFRKVRLDPGERTRVAVTLDQRAFSSWSVRHRRWVVEAGDFTISVGSSSRDLPLSNTVTVDAPPIRPALSRMATAQEWMDDPIGRALLEEILPEHSRIRDPEFIRMLGSFPIDTIAGFGTFGLTHAALDEVVARLPATDEPTAA